MPFKKLGLDSQRAKKLASKLHVHFVNYTARIVCTKRALFNTSINPHQEAVLDQACNLLISMIFFPEEELYGTRYQSGSFPINVGSGLPPAQEAGEFFWRKARPISGLNPPDPPPTPQNPLPVPPPRQKGTNLLHFKFCIHLHTHQDLELKYCRVMGQNWDTDAHAHMTYQAPITGLHSPTLLPFL